LGINCATTQDATFWRDFIEVREAMTTGRSAL